MDHTAGTAKQRVRSIFISDQHLGFKFSRAEACLQFLRQYQPERLYLVGDFLDGWRLQNRWYWPPIYDQLVDHILQMIQGGTQVFYTPGNHDDFLRNPHPAIDGVQIADEFFHPLVDGGRLLVTHGDLFDSVEKKYHRLSRFGSSIYDNITQVNFLTNKLMIRAGLNELNYCFAVKRWSKQIVGAVGGFETVLTEYALQQNCQGVICGHIHRPTLKQSAGGSFIYCNTGDWVENQSAVIETFHGELILENRGVKVAALALDQPLTTDSNSAFTTTSV